MSRYSLVVVVEGEHFYHSVTSCLMAWLVGQNRSIIVVVVVEVVVVAAAAAAVVVVVIVVPNLVVVVVVVYLSIGA